MELAEGGTLSGGAMLGTNDFGKAGYGGPAPPPGKPHRYFFRLYALDDALDLDAGCKRKDLLAAMHGHILAEAELMGTYAR
jgi:Raf kinase inhibitor-like YbhB/YbcL family protein